MAESDLDRLVADLTAIKGLIPKKAEQAVQQTAIRTKKSWQADAKGIARGRYAPTIDYTVEKPAAGNITAEIGPDLARYGGRTGKGGLIPSMGILDDPQSSGGIRTPPSRARRRAEKFAADELEKGIKIAVDQSMKERGL